MRRSTIPQTDLTVSRIAYGCMGIGGSWDDLPITEASFRLTEELIDTAFEQGINLFDHADIYCCGKSEAVFGRLLSEKPHLRDKMVLQSKCGIRIANDPVPGVPKRYDLSYDYIIASVEGILQRLQTDYLDILLLHRPDPLMQPEEVARAFDTLKQAGKVRYFGVSNFNAPQLALLQSALDMPLVVNQLEISLLHHQLISEGIFVNQAAVAYAAAAGTLDYCRMKGILVQAWSPLGGGKLFQPDEQSPKYMHETAAVVYEIAEKRGCSADTIMLNWLLRHPAGIQPIIGTTKSERIASSCRSDEVELSREEWYALYSAVIGRRVP